MIGYLHFFAMCEIFYSNSVGFLSPNLKIKQSPDFSFISNFTDTSFLLVLTQYEVNIENAKCILIFFYVQIEILKMYFINKFTIYYEHERRV